MKNLLENDFPKHYGVGRRRSIVACSTTEEKFDLKDINMNFIVPFGAGDVSLLNRKLDLEVVNYDNYLGLFKPLQIENGKKRCDFIMYDTNSAEIIVLCEITSANNRLENLHKPIIDKKTGKIIFPGGKYEKAELQLYETLANIIPVPKIKEFVETKNRKVCLVGYYLNTNKKGQATAQIAFNRGRLMEAEEAGENGSQISNPPMEDFGFTYYRIFHKFAFQL